MLEKIGNIHHYQVINQASFKKRGTLCYSIFRVPRFLCNRIFVDYEACSDPCSFTILL